MIELTKSKFTIDEIEVDKDHIHILADSDPTQSPLDFVRLAKMMTTYHAWRSDWTPFLRSIYWKERTLWSDGYFVATTGQASTETIRQYIESQG
jgi:putative transposase